MVDYSIRICFEQKQAYTHNCVSYLQEIKEAGGCTDQNDAICFVWFEGMSSAPLIGFNIAYAALCGECLIKALNCKEYQVEQVTFFT